MPFQLTDQGLETQTQSAVREDVLARLKSKFGNTLAANTTSISGQFADVVAELLASVQQVVLGVNASFDPNAAEGVQLDQRAALTGSVRKGAVSSSVEGVLTATGACVVPDGTLYRNGTYRTVWQTTGGPYVFLGAGTQAATVEAVETGPLVAQAGDTWSAITVIANLTGFTNPVEDAALGRVVESDAAFRWRRTAELFARGNGPLLAVQGVVSRVQGVLSCRVYHNPTEFPVGTNPNKNIGIPFKAGNVVVETDPPIPGAALQQAILDAAWSAAGLGVELYGTDYTGIVTDSEGQTHAAAFDVVESVDVYLRVTIVTANLGGGDDPVVPLVATDMALLIRTACVTAARNRFTVAGRDFRPLDYSGVITAMISAGQLSGIDELTVQVSSDGVSWGTTLYVPITIRQKIDFDTSKFSAIIDGAAVVL